METTEFKNKVRTALTESGLMLEDDSSIFSSEKVIRNESDNSMMLVGPQNEAWTFVSSFMTDEQIDAAIEQFLTTVKQIEANTVDTKLLINYTLSLADFIAALAKLFGGDSSSTKLANTPIKELVTKAITPINDK